MSHIERVGRCEEGIAINANVDEETHDDQRAVCDSIDVPQKQSASVELLKNGEVK